MQYSADYALVTLQTDELTHVLVTARV